jgi:hypothetical protein
VIFDATLQFSNAQAITATAASTNSIDFGPGGTVYGAAAALVRDVAKSTDLVLLIQVTEVFNNLTSLTIALELDTTTTFTPDKSISLGTFLLADLVAGFVFPWRELPPGINMRYAQLKYTVAGTAPTTGKITAGIVSAVQTN